ncbi:MAG: S41 family peptidase [Thermoanaerobaculales bacterium]
MKQKAVFLALSVVVILTVVALASGAAASAGKGVYRLMGLLGQVVQLVRTNHVEEVPIDKIELGALSGLVEGADPGGCYVPEESARSFAHALNRSLPPFGLALGKRASYPVVLEVVADSPAAKAGIVSGELIERVGGEPVRARPLWLALVLLDAAERRGDAVSLDVIDRQVSGKRLVTLSPGVASMPSPKVELKGDVPVASLAVVDSEVAKRLATALEPRASASALVVDLRGVALGNPTGAVEVAAALAGGEMRLRLVGRDGKDQVLRSRAPLRRWKLVVCLDGTTAGPAELLAATLKGAGAMLVGGETYGDTGQREPRPAAGGEVWLASSWGVGPDEKPLLGNGLKPDEIVRGRKGADPVLDRALELAAGGKVEKKAA